MGSTENGLILTFSLHTDQAQKKDDDGKTQHLRYQYYDVVSFLFIINRPVNREILRYCLDVIRHHEGCFYRKKLCEDFKE